MTKTVSPITDLIYTRLDLPQMPEIDSKAVTDWMLCSQREVIDERRVHQSNTSNQEYPWRAVYVCSNSVWNESFVATFPQLREYLNHFPTNAWRRVILLAQLPNEHVFLHTDPDAQIGWRLYLNHGGPRLYFQKFKERHVERPSTWLNGGPKAMQELCSPERIYVEDKGAYPWALTSVRAAHGVEPHCATLGARITMLLFPEPSAIRVADHHSLLWRSAEKFSDTAIWF
jgi:hypothetical protein